MLVEVKKEYNPLEDLRNNHWEEKEISTILRIISDGRLDELPPTPKKFAQGSIGPECKAAIEAMNRLKEFYQGSRKKVKTN